MGKLLCDSSTTTIAESYQPSPPPPPPPALPWRDPKTIESTDLDDVLKTTTTTTTTTWEGVSGLEDQQRRYLERLDTKGVLWKHPNEGEGEGSSMVFRLSHGGDVEADGNCLFTASKKAMGLEIDARELRRRTVKRFLEDLELVDGEERGSIDSSIKHLYSPDLKVGWGIHVVQEVKLLARKADRIGFDGAINELVDLGLQREFAAESIYKERCIEVDNAENWAKYMSTSGSPEDEFDIITLQYTEEGLLSVDENREGHAAAFGDDIAIVSLATEFKREVYVVQAHGSDAMVDAENCVFFLPHRPRNEICAPPFFLFMKGTGWSCAGADHYEPLIAHSSPLLSQEKGVVVL